VAEDFKLGTGTWVHVGALRVKLIAAGDPIIQDAVITGHDRSEIGALVFLSAAAKGIDVKDKLIQILKGFEAEPSSARISRLTPHSLVPSARAAIGRVDPRLALADVRTMEEIVGGALRQQRMSAVLVAGFALAAVLLAGMGLFGVVSGSVTRRRHEFAVRLALGAVPGGVVRLVLAEGARLVAMGILIALPGIVLAGDVLRGVLVGVSPADPPTLAGVAAGLAMVAMVACYLPARRALAIEPAQSLRQE
jgi:ABC-type antimicrobial peptide transport system permease subunit